MDKIVKLGVFEVPHLKILRSAERSWLLEDIEEIIRISLVPPHVVSIFRAQGVIASP